MLLFDTDRHRVNEQSRNPRQATTITDIINRYGKPIGAMFNEEQSIFITAKYFYTENKNHCNGDA